MGQQLSLEIPAESCPGKEEKRKCGTRAAGAGFLALGCIGKGRLFTREGGRTGTAGEDDCSGGSQSRDGVSTRNDRAALEEMDAGGEPTLSLR